MSTIQPSIVKVGVQHRMLLQSNPDQVGSMSRGDLKGRSVHIYTSGLGKWLAGVFKKSVVIDNVHYNKKSLAKFVARTTLGNPKAAENKKVQSAVLSAFEKVSAAARTTSTGTSLLHKHIQYQVAPKGEGVSTPRDYFVEEGAIEDPRNWVSQFETEVHTPPRSPRGVVELVEVSEEPQTLSDSEGMSNYLSSAEFSADQKATVELDMISPELYAATPKHLFKQKFHFAWKNILSLPAFQAKADFSKMIAKAKTMDQLEMQSDADAIDQIKEIISAAGPAGAILAKAIPNFAREAEAATAAKMKKDAEAKVETEREIAAQRREFVALAGENQSIARKLETIFDAAPKDLFGEAELPIWQGLLLTQDKDAPYFYAIDQYDLKDITHEADDIAQARVETPPNKADQIFQILDKGCPLGPHRDILLERMTTLTAG